MPTTYADPVRIFIVIAVVLFALDRLARWAEGRGWLYYRTSGSATGSVMTGLDPIWNPAAKHLQAEERRMQDYREGEADGAPPRFGLPEDSDD